MSKTIINLEISGKNVNLSLRELPEETDIDDLVMIHIQKIEFDIITFPVVMAKFGVLRAELNRIANLAKVNLTQREANVRKSLRKENLNKSRAEKRSIPEIDAEVDSHPLVLKMSQDYFNHLANYEKVDAIYWAMKDKGDKLTKISGKITSTDIMEKLLDTDIKVFNGVKIEIEEL